MVYKQSNKNMSAQKPKTQNWGNSGAVPQQKKGGKRNSNNKMMG